MRDDNMSCFCHTVRSSLTNTCIHHDSSKYREDKTRYQTRKIYERNTERKREVTTDRTANKSRKKDIEKKKKREEQEM